MDLHTHTGPDGATGPEFKADAFVAWALGAGLNVLAVTDHNSVDRVLDIIAGADSTDLVVVPGIEIDTDRGHILALSPSPEWEASLRGLMDRIGVSDPGQVKFTELVEAWKQKDETGRPRLERILLFAAHADQAGSLLATGQTLSVIDQVRQAAELDGIEVVDAQKAREWASLGIKQESGAAVPILAASDSHFPAAHFPRTTWMYIPKVTVRDMRHSLATPECSVELAEECPSEPSLLIKSVTFSGGKHNGETFEFSDRCTALIGPPLSGKSLIVDSLRYVFDVPHTLDEIQRLSEARLRSGLGAGSTVRVTLEAGGEQHVIERIYGGEQIPQAPFRPIVFSQSELVARSMEPEPAMSLVDLHARGTRTVKARLDAIAGEVQQHLRAAIVRATRVAELRARLTNPEDGLEVHRRKVMEFTGGETSAQQAVDQSQVQGWRDTVVSALADWLAAFVTPPGPEIPAVPSRIADPDALAGFLPGDRLESMKTVFRDDVSSAARSLADSMQSELTSSEPAFSELRADLSRRLEEQGIGEGGSYLTELTSIRSQLDQLEREAAEFDQLGKALVGEIGQLHALISEAEEQKQALRKIRVETCKAISMTMPTFRCRLSYDDRTSNTNALLDHAKTGTHFQEATLSEARNKLDRPNLVETVVRMAMGEAPELPSADLASQYEISRVVVERQDPEQLGAYARLAVYWPGDSLLIERKSDDAEFRELSEGLKALAIKEISFALSDRPVITDQPEDAVTPSAVFENLVPTLRTQRGQRQFIVASHDANIVVAGDMERIIVLDPQGASRPGTLSDTEIGEEALLLLEGGPVAFERRAARYRNL